MRKENKKNKGFSLVELIIVIAIMVILGAIIAPQYFKHVANAKISSDVEQAARISAAISAEYATEQVEFPATSKFVVTPAAATVPTWTAVSLIPTVTGTVSNSKVESGGVFYYSLAINGDVQIGISATVPGATGIPTSHIISPLNAAATAWGGK